MKRVSVVVTSAGATTQYAYTSENLTVFVERQGGAPQKEELVSLEKECSKFEKELDSIVCRVVVVERKHTNEINVLAAKALPDLTIEFSESFVSDPAVSFADLISHALRLARKVISKLSDLEKNIVVTSPQNVATAPEDEASLPHAVKCFKHLSELGITGQDAAKVISMSAERVLPHKVPITDEDYKAIYEDLRRPFSWALFASLVNLLYERAGLPHPSNDAEYTEAMGKLRRKILKAFPPFRNYPLALTQWSYAFYYFIYAKIMNNEITISKEEVEHGTEEDTDL